MIKKLLALTLALAFVAVVFARPQLPFPLNYGSISPEGAGFLCIGSPALEGFSTRCGPT